MPNTKPHVCIPCRSTNGCPKNEHDTHSMTSKWRAPKKTNDRAWKMIESGDWWWDKRRISKIRRREWEDQLVDGNQNKPVSKIHWLLKEIYRKRYLTRSW